MKTVFHATFLSLLTAANAFGHSTGLAHAHPHSNSSSFLAAFVAISIAAGLGWMAIRQGKRAVSRARSRK